MLGRWLRSLRARPSLLYERLKRREREELRPVDRLALRLGRLETADESPEPERSLEQWGEMVIEDRSPRP